MVFLEQFYFQARCCCDVHVYSLVLQMHVGEESQTVLNVIPGVISSAMLVSNV